MSGARRSAVVAVAGLTMAWSASLWAAGLGVGGGAQAGAQPPKVKPVRMSTGNIALGGALEKLDLSADQKTAVADALTAWKAQQADAAKALAEKRTALKDQIKQETDKAKKQELTKQLAELKGPTQLELYASAKAAIQDKMPAEQFARIDELAKAVGTELGAKQARGMVDGWAAKGIELTEDQKTKVAAVMDTLTADLAKVAPGATDECRSLAMKAVWAIRNDVLTDEQRAKLTPPKREKPTSRPDSMPAGATD